MPTPRFPILARQTRPDQISQKITVETVEAIQGGKYQILGELIPARGPLRVIVGSRVHVLWSQEFTGDPIQGKINRPILVLDYDDDQGKPTTPPLGGAGIVEQIYVGTVPSTGVKDVLFRDFGQITPLGVAAFIPGIQPKAAFWGTNRDVFGVTEGTGAGTKVHVFKLTRNVDKVLGTTKAKIKELLYSKQVSATPAIDLITITANWKRDSIEPYALMEWHPAGGGGAPCSPNCHWVLDLFTIKRDTNVNTANVSRTLTVRLTGLTISFVNGSPIPATDSVVPSPPPGTMRAELDPLSFFIDAANDVIWVVKIICADFGIWQGNSTVGLTGTYSRKGDGDEIGVGICPFLTFCPHIVDTDPAPQDFMDHGNVSGILSTHIDETHAVVINGRAGTALWKTFATLRTLELEETSNGAHPYRVEHDTQMPAAPNNEWCYLAATFPGPGGWRTGVAENIPVDFTIDLGNMGDVGTLKNEGSLFDQSLGFQPDLPMGNDPTPGTPTRKATVRVLVESQGYDQEWSDAFGSHCGPFSGHVPTAARASWRALSVGVFNRYNIDVAVTPFAADAGGTYFFVTVFREAKKPINFTTDVSQYGVFIVKRSALFATAQAYTNATSAVRPKLMTGSLNRVLWRKDEDWFMTDFFNGAVTVKVGGSASDPKAQELRLTNEDLLYATDEKHRYFVKYKNKTTGQITLSQGGENFPPRDAQLAAIGGLKDLQSENMEKDPPLTPSWHVIPDKALLKK